MIPDPDMQLQVVIKALREVVMPALDPAQSTAIEQLGLSVATLTMLRTRLPHIAAREWIDLADAIEMGDRVAAVGGDAGLSEATEAGRGLLAMPCPPAAALGPARDVILSAIGTAVNAARDDRLDELMRLVIAGSEPSVDMARAWSKPAGFDPDPQEVRDLPELLRDRIEGCRED